MLTFASALIVSYLLGSIPAGYLAGRLAGVDIRKAGSGNIGATNVMRVLGKAYGYPVFAIDFLKGLALHIPSDSLRVGSIDNRRDCTANRYSHYDLSGSGAHDGAALFLNLSCCHGDFATSLKSFSSGAWHRATVQTKVNIDRIAIVGAGSWGTALAWLWGKDGRQILLWGNNAGRVARMQKTRENTDYLPRAKLPNSIDITHDLRDCANAGLVVFVTPSTVLRGIAMRLQGVLGTDQGVLLSCTKGIEH